MHCQLSINPLKFTVMKKEKRLVGSPVIMAGMRRVVYFLMALCLSVNLHAHEHHTGCSHSHPNESNFTGVLKCSVCSGKGRCFMCMGSGMIYSIMGPTPCPGCFGSGKCGMCGGTGLIVIPENPNPVPVPEPVPTPNPTPDSHACRVCNGTGQKISERWMGSQTSQRKWCSICNKNVLQTHQHVRCDNCNGTGRVKY